VSASTDPVRGPGPMILPTQLAGEICRFASDKKAADIVEIDLRGVVGYTDYFVIATGNTERQTKAIHDGILAGIKQEYSVTPRRVEGFTAGAWVLMDYLDVVVHIFTPATREFYRLERLWGEAPARAVLALTEPVRAGSGPEGRSWIRDELYEQ
jgi:ribosome-associated protein